MDSEEEGAAAAEEKTHKRRLHRTVWVEEVNLAFIIPSYKNYVQRKSWNIKSFWEWYLKISMSF